MRKPEITTVNKSIPGLNITPKNVTEPTTESVLDYIYHLLVTFLVVLVGFGFGIRHLMVREKSTDVFSESDVDDLFREMYPQHADMDAKTAFHHRESCRVSLKKTAMARILDAQFAAQNLV